MRALILGIITAVVITLPANSKSLHSLDLEFQKMSTKQIKILIRSYLEGKEYDVGYSLAAIAWQESQAGKYLINLNSKDCGVYQKSIPGYIKSIDKKYNSFLVNSTCQKFIENRGFASAVAVSDLVYWKDVRKGNWNKIWASYNCGYQKNCGKKYSKDIHDKILILKKYIK